MIDDPSSYKIIYFVDAKNVNAAEIHSELWAAYGQNVMSEGTVWFGVECWNG
jgi:hypothetical protein